jgi:hypothetical protein
LHDPAFGSDVSQEPSGDLRIRLTEEIPPSPAMLHHYLIKTAIVLVVIIALNLALNVSFMLPIPRLRRMPIWLRGLLTFAEICGWIVIVALVVAAIWQIADRH